MHDLAVEFQGVTKSFGPVQANRSVDLKILAGSIHAIVGENGAGKSTAMKMLFGLYSPDAGKILVHGQQVRFSSPIEAMENQIGMVHQHFMLASPMTALDNVLLYQRGGAFGRLPRASQKKDLQKIAERYGLTINLDAKVENLSVGEQQRLEILKVLCQDAKIIILDEPTAVLTPQETQDLFKNLRLLKSEGKTIIIITHKLKEVMAISDEVTVFRSGQIINSKKTSATNTDELAEMMIGRRTHTPAARQTTVDTTEIRLHFNNVSANLGPQAIKNIQLKVHAKEIVGIAGVEGNGQDLLIRALLDRPAFAKDCFSGTIQKAATLAAFPEDRLRYGALASRPAYENFLLGQQRKTDLLRGPFLNIKKVVQDTLSAMISYDVRPRDPYANFGSLSGGNQQKLVVARTLARQPDLLIAAQPTRGVDIGAVEFIHQKIRQERDRGAGILLISSELDELMTLADRIVVIYRGQLVAEFPRHEFSEIALGTAMGGAQ